LARNSFLDYTYEGRNFLGDERDTEYRDTPEYHILRPADFLRIILKSDKELKDTFLGWMSDITNYQQLATEHVNAFYEQVITSSKRLITKTYNIMVQCQSQLCIKKKHFINCHYKMGSN
jgi:hypothetical protein